VFFGVQAPLPQPFFGLISVACDILTSKYAMYMFNVLLPHRFAQVMFS